MARSNPLQMNLLAADAAPAKQGFMNISITTMAPPGRLVICGYRLAHGLVCRVRVCGIQLCGVRVFVARLLILMLMAGSVLAEWHHDEQAVMGTRVSVSLWSDEKAKGRAAVDAVMTEMRRLDAHLSTYNPDSHVSQVNRAAGKGAVDISAELARLIDKSLYFSRLSDGAFDISYASVGRHYDYRSGQQPSDAERQALLDAINYELINLDRANQQVSFGHPQLHIGFGGIAKGYAVDRCVEILVAMGITSANISAGGDSRVLGDKRGKPWLVGIRHPRGDNKKDVAIVLPLDNVAISTSGDYERYFFEAGSRQRIHHILNPKTGKSASGIASVSIVGPRAFDTDPLSTTVFVMGVEPGLAMLETLPAFEGVIIDAAGKVHYTRGLAPPD